MIYFSCRIIPAWSRKASEKMTGGNVMPIEFDITLTPGDMYRFNLYQTYSGFQGWFAILVSVLAFASAWVTYGDVEMTYTVLYTACGVIFLFYVPINLYMRSGHTLRTSEVLKKPLHYAVDEKGFAVSQGEESALLEWEQIYKMISTKSSVLVYSNRTNAYVIPRGQLGGKYERLRALALTRLPGYRIRMRQSSPENTENR